MSKKNTSNGIKSKTVKVPLGALVSVDKFCGTLASSSLVSHGNVARIIRSVPIQFLRNYSEILTTRFIRGYLDSRRNKNQLSSLCLQPGTNIDVVDSPVRAHPARRPHPHPHSGEIEQQAEGITWIPTILAIS